MKPHLIFPTIYSILFFLNLYIGEKIRTKLQKYPEISRKSVHILSGLVALTFPYTIKSHLTIFLLLSFFGTVLFITKKYKLLPSLYDVKRKSFGDLYYPIAIYIIYYLASETPVIYFTSILVMTISDATASLLGQRYGTIKYKIAGNTKTLEGSICFLFSAFLCVLLPLILMSSIGNPEAVIISAIIAIILTGLESISLTGSDNILIPFGTYFIITKMSSLPLSSILENFYILLATTFFLVTCSIFRTSGTIAIMLLNYAAFTLTNLFWIYPLLITEALLCSITYSYRKNNPNFRTIVYIGILPTLFIFLFNTVNNSNLFYSYLISILAYIPLTFNFYLHSKERISFKISQLLAFISISLISCSSLYFFENEINTFSILYVLSGVYIIYGVYFLIHKILFPNQTIGNNYKILTISSIAYLIISYGLIFGGHLYA